MTDARIVLTTVSNVEQAEQLARHLVELRLATCVNLIDRVRSVYRWQEDIETADEVMLVIKTTLDRIATLKEKLDELHPYELPELIVLEVSDGSNAYLTWLAAGCRDEN